MVSIKSAHTIAFSPRAVGACDFAAGIAANSCMSGSARSLTLVPRDCTSTARLALLICPRARYSAAGLRPALPEHTNKSVFIADASPSIVNHDPLDLTGWQVHFDGRLASRKRSFNASFEAPALARATEGGNTPVVRSPSRGVSSAGDECHLPFRPGRAAAR